MGETPGWYGKLPVLGDFAQRRLPADFVVTWDVWLQQGIASSQLELGADWLNAYLTAHVWHFVLMPGVLGASGWAGVLTPSVDRVGRYFPFTVAAPLPPGQVLGASVSALGGWLRQLEDCARQALAMEGGIDVLEEALARLGPPRPGLAPAGEFTRIEEQFSRRDEVVGLHALGAPGEPDCLETLAACSLQATLAGYSLWWCHGENGTSGGFAHRNLPGAPFLTKMLTYSPAG